MALGTQSTSRELHLVWAFLAIFFASLIALTLIGAGPYLQTCTECGTTVEGSFCDGNSPGGCGEGLATAVALATVTSGLSLLFAIHASAAYRLKRGLGAASLLKPEGRSGPILIQVASLAVMAEGALFAAAAGLTPLFQFCLEGCPAPYTLSGITLQFALVGLLALLGGTTTFLVSSWALSRQVETARVENRPRIAARPSLLRRGRLRVAGGRVHSLGSVTRPVWDYRGPLCFYRVDS